MTEEEMETAHAFVACSRWKWLPGMLALYFFSDDPGTLWPDRLHGEPGHLVGTAQGLEVDPSGTYPNPATYVAVDHTDPATLGCILQLVQDAGGLIFKLSIRPMGDMLVVEWPNGRLDSFRGTFSRVLLQALQAAPEAS